MERLLKQFAMKDAAMEDNTITGVASVMGNLDSYNDVIFPGAFKGSVLTNFLSAGFVSVGHSRGGLPIAMPKEAKEVKNELQTKAVFHSTDAAQNARTVCMERIANGLSVGLSIGFGMDYTEESRMYFDSGKELLKHAEENGHDMTLFDVAGIKKCKTYCRAIKKVAALYEYSIVTVPANPRATATDVKSFDPDNPEFCPIILPTTEREFEDFLRSVGWSRAQATSLTLHGFKSVLAKSDSQTTTQREAERDADQRRDAEDDLKADDTETTIPDPTPPVQRESEEERAEMKKRFERHLSLKPLQLQTV